MRLRFVLSQRDWAPVRFFKLFQQQTGDSLSLIGLDEVVIQRDP